MKNSSDVQNLTLWNQLLADELLPDTLILVLYMLIGTIGNSTVIFVYARRFRGQIDDRFFIPYLALVDLVSCITCSSFGISVNLLPVNFTNDSACKILWFLAMATTGCSAFSLMVIAVQRYQKICKPFGRQMTSQSKKIAIGIVVGIAIVLSIPCFLFYGSAPIFSDEWNVTGYRCTSIPGNFGKIPPLIFKGLIFLSVIGDLIGLCVLYTMIGRVIFKQVRFRKQQGVPAIADSSDDALDSSTTKGNIASDDASGATLVSVVSFGKSKPLPLKMETSFSSEPFNGLPSVDREVPNAYVPTTVPYTPPPKDEKKLKKNTKVQRTPGFRLSLMFMVITIVFIICFLPKMGMLLYESRNPDFWLKLTPSEMGGYRFLYTMYIINNIVNPFIYGFFDKKFQREFLKLFCCCWSR